MASEPKPPFDEFLDKPITRLELSTWSEAFSVAALDAMREKGKGPPFLRGEGSRKIFYTRRAFIKWLENKDVTPPNLSHPSAFVMRQVLSGTIAGQIERDTGIKLTDSEARAIALNANEDENGTSRGRKTND